MKTMYIILSKKHGSAKEPVFWRPDDAGYTIFPWAAGTYSEEAVKKDPTYYNNGFDSVAIPLNNQGLEAIGFKCSYSEAKLNQFIEKEEQL